MDQGRFARAGAADEADHLARLGGEADVFQHVIARAGRLYLKDTSRNSTRPVVTAGPGAGRASSGLSTMSTSVSSTSSTRTPLASARADMMMIIEIIITLIRIWIT